MCSDRQLRGSLFSPLFLEFHSAHTTAVKDCLCHISLIAYTLFEVASKPIPELMPHFITDCGCMTIEKPDVTLLLGKISKELSNTFSTYG